MRYVIADTSAFRSAVWEVSVALSMRIKKRLCGVQFLRAQLTIRNCLHTLVLAAQYDCNNLFDNAVSFLWTCSNPTCNAESLFVIAFRNAFR